MNAERTSSSSHKLRSHVTLSLLDHKVDKPELIYPRSPALKRVSSSPGFLPDVAKETVKEHLLRRRVHSDLLSSDEQAFRKTVSHPDLQPVPKFRDFSRPQSPEKIGFKSFPFLSPEQELNDFGYPDNYRPRTSGYSPGHMRFRQKLDAYGEKTSLLNLLDTVNGSRPVSPNTDRYRLLAPRSAPATLFCRANHSAYKKAYGLRKVPKTALDPSTSFRDSLSTELLSKNDPIIRGKEWHKTYLMSKLSRQSSLECDARQAASRNSNRQEAEQNQEMIYVFERSLPLKVTRVV